MKNLVIYLILSSLLFSKEIINEDDFKVDQKKIKKIIADLNTTQYTKINKPFVKKAAKKKQIHRYDFIEDMWDNTYGKNAPITGSFIKKSLNNMSSPIKNVDTIFYLFSLGVNDVSFNNFFFDAQRIKKDFLYFGGLNGFPKDNLKIAFSRAVNKQYAKDKVQYKVKLTPYFYKDLNVKEVPAYIFAKCPNKKDGSFKHIDCEYKYMIRGDITLTKALEILSSKDKYYKQFYRKMIVKE